MSWPTSGFGKLGHRAGSGATIWLQRGIRVFTAEWLWSEHSGGPSADETRAALSREVCATSPQDLLLADPGPRGDVRRPGCTKAWRVGPCTPLPFERLSDEKFFAPTERLDDPLPYPPRPTPVTVRLHRPGRRLLRRGRLSGLWDSWAVLEGRGLNGSDQLFECRLRRQLGQSHPSTHGP